MRREAQRTPGWQTQTAPKRATAWAAQTYLVQLQGAPALPPAHSGPCALRRRVFRARCAPRPGPMLSEGWWWEGGDLNGAGRNEAALVPAGAVCRVEHGGGSAVKGAVSCRHFRPCNH